MKFVKKYKCYFLAFLLPLIILITVFLCKGIFNDYSILASDMNVQGAPFLKYFHNLLHNDASFPYSFSKGIGGNMYGTFFYHLSSPLSLFVYFFDDISLFCAILVLLKISLCGLTMFTYLKRKFDCKEIYLLIFALAYALMGYNINYYTNIMWLDGVILAPIILLGIENIINKNKHFIYIVSLFMAIVSNYYIGYILTLFSLLYYLYLSYINYDGEKWLKNNFKKIRQFIGITFLIGLLTAFILVPIALESRNFVRLINNDKMINYNFFDLFAGSYIGFANALNPLNQFGFLTYSGILMIPLIVAYFTNKKISRREKKATLIIYLLFLLPVIIKPLNLLWHLFTYPQLFSYRYSFLVSLFSIIISIKSFIFLDTNKRVSINTFILGLILSISLGYLCYQEPEYYVFLKPFKVIISVVILGAYCYLIYKKKSNIIITLFLFELVFNIGLFGYETTFFKKSFYNESLMINQSIGKYCHLDKRCEVDLTLSMNNSFYGNYQGVSSFNSSTHKKQNNVLHRLRGLDSGNNLYLYDTYDLMSDMLLGIEYIGTVNDIKDYTLIETMTINEDKLKIYQNPNALSLGFLVSPNIKEFSSNKVGYTYLNEILMVMSDTDDSYLIELPFEKTSDTEYIIKKDKKYPYIYVDSDIPISNYSFDNMNDADEYGIIFDDSDDDFILYYDKKPKRLKIYTVDTDKISSFKDSRTELNIDINNGNYLSGTIDVEKKSTLFMSIINEDGWKVYVDDKLVDHYELLDSFIGIDLDTGIHKIELRYSIPGLELGVCISLISLITLIVYELKNREAN